jgi:hypothetical protein
MRDMASPMYTCDTLDNLPEGGGRDKNMHGMLTLSCRRIGRDRIIELALILPTFPGSKHSDMCYFVHTVIQFSCV